MIEQGASPDAASLYHVTTRTASILVEAGQAVWAIPGQVIRKTHRYGRMEADSRVRAGRPFALRGLSAEIGETLTVAVRRRQDWALTALAQIRMQLESSSHAD